jgi:hypothetical protein
VAGRSNGDHLNLNATVAVCHQAEAKPGSCGSGLGMPEPADRKCTCRQCKSCVNATRQPYICSGPVSGQPAGGITTFEAVGPSTRAAAGVHWLQRAHSIHGSRGETFRPPAWQERDRGLRSRCIATNSALADTSFAGDNGSRTAARDKATSGDSR